MTKKVKSPLLTDADVARIRSNHQEPRTRPTNVTKVVKVHDILDGHGTSSYTYPEYQYLIKSELEIIRRMREDRKLLRDGH